MIGELLARSELSHDDVGEMYAGARMWRARDVTAVREAAARGVR